MNLITILASDQSQFMATVNVRALSTKMQAKRKAIAKTAADFISPASLSGSDQGHAGKFARPAINLQDFKQIVALAHT